MEEGIARVQNAPILPIAAGGVREQHAHALVYQLLQSAVPAAAAARDAASALAPAHAAPGAKRRTGRSRAGPRGCNGANRLQEQAAVERVLGSRREQRARTRMKEMAGSRNGGGRGSRRAGGRADPNRAQASAFTTRMRPFTFATSIACL